MMALQKLAGPAEALKSPEIRFISFLVGACTFHGAVILLAREFVRNQSTSWHEAFGMGASSLIRVLAFAIGTAILALPVTWVLTTLSATLLTWGGIEPQVQQAVKTLQETRGTPERIIFALSAIVLAPIAEEVLFRGILYPAIRALDLRRWALWGTSLLFAAVHANLMTFIPLTLLALMLTYIYERTRDLRAPILAHSLFNAVNFFYLLREAGI